MTSIVEKVNRLKAAAIMAFMSRMGDAARGMGVHLIEDPTEAITADLLGGKRAKLRTLSLSGGGARARLEENYLFDTRRFPSYLTGETFPAALSSGQYLFFMNAIGSPAANNGFSPLTTPTMSGVETNMDTPGQVPQGKNYVMTQVGISFNTDIATADAATLLEAGSLVFQKQGGQFTLQHGRPSFWGGGMGLSTSLATGSPATNGNPDIRAVRKLAVPRVLGQRDNFSYVFNVPRVYRNTAGTTTTEGESNAMTLSAPAIMTVWLWGGQEDSIPT